MAGVTKEELLAAIEDDFQDACVDDAKVQKLLEKMADGTAGYDEVQAYSKRIGQLLSKSFNKHVTAEALPDGLTLEMAQTAIQKPLIETYDMAAKAAAKYVEAQNTKAGIGIKPKLPEHNPHKVKNFVEKVSDKPLDEIGWMLDEPVVNHTMSAVDDTVKVNADVQTKLGLNVTITRSTVGKSTCNWCRNLAGTYHYNDVNQGGHDVWRRHAHCDCKIEYISAKDYHVVNNYVKGNMTERQRKEAARKEAQAPNDRTPEKVAERQNLQFPDDAERIAIRKAATNVSGRGIIKKRSLAQGLRQPANRILIEEEIDSIKRDAEDLGIPLEILRFNTGKRTGFNDDDVLIGICGDVLPDKHSKQARDVMSEKAVLAHEYYGHYLHHPSEFEIGDWRDEFRASYRAALDAPALSDEDRAYLMTDAYDRAREAGITKEYDNTARRIIYGY